MRTLEPMGVKLELGRLDQHGSEPHKNTSSDDQGKFGSVGAAGRYDGPDRNEHRANDRCVRSAPVVDRNAPQDG